MYEKTMSLFKDYIDRDIKVAVDKAVAEKDAENKAALFEKDKLIDELKAKIAILEKA